MLESGMMPLASFARVGRNLLILLEIITIDSSFKKFLYQFDSEYSPFHYIPTSNYENPTYVTIICFAIQIMNPNATTELSLFIGNISAISVTLVKLVSTLSQLVDEVGQAVPPEVQRLANELAALYSSLGQIKLSLSLLPDRESASLARWNAEFRIIIEDCKEVVGILSDIVERSKKMETQYVGAQRWRRIKFTFRIRQVEVVRIRLVWYNILFDKMNFALGEYVIN